MAGNANNSDDDAISGINVTPLVDVVLVLLIIFMVTAPVIYQSAIKVQLPKAQTGEVSPKNIPLSFTISKDGTLYWGKDIISSWEELGRRLAKLGPEASNMTAIIGADAAVPHGSVIRLMDALRQAGLVHFALSVEVPTEK